MAPAAVANVPLLMTLPNKSRVPDPTIVSEPPLLIVMFLAVPVPAAMTGILGAVDGMVTSVVDAGTPPHQFEGVFQSVLVTPIQVCADRTVMVIPADVAVVCVTQVNEVVITTVITSLFANVEFWYVI